MVGVQIWYSKEIGLCTAPPGGVWAIYNFNPAPLYAVYKKINFGRQRLSYAISNCFRSENDGKQFSAPSQLSKSICFEQQMIIYNGKFNGKSPRFYGQAGGCWLTPLPPTHWRPQRQPSVFENLILKRCLFSGDLPILSCVWIELPKRQQGQGHSRKKVGT